MFNIAVFVSGRGSNLKSIIDKSIDTDINVSAVVSDKTDCPAFNLALEQKIDIYSVSSKKKSGFLDYKQLKVALDKKKIELIVLAGFLKKIPEDFIDQFPNKIINIHPALLPAFGGKGMYGMNVHKAVFESSAKISGATVHFVNKNYDEGKIIAQRCVDISKVDSFEQIASLVLAEEHNLLPFVINKFAENKIIIKNDRVFVED